jgi:prepilin-type N-terminal cleavage/methylation domain-containing protein
MTPITRLTGSRRDGFTLVELLLAVTLLAGLMAAAVFGFSALHRNAQLNEGVERVETAMRFARAHAANTGRKVQVVVTTTEAGTATTTSGSSGSDSVDGYGVPPSLSILWEADPTRAPGVFEAIPSLSADMADVGDLIEIRSIDRDSGKDASGISNPGANPSSIASSTGPAMSMPGAEIGAETEGQYESESAALDTREPSASAGRDLPPGEATITFYPDGSCDGATLVLASRDIDDSREVAVHLESVTGTTRRQWREPAGSAGGEAMPSTTGPESSKGTDNLALRSTSPRASAPPAVSQKSRR